MQARTSTSGGRAILEALEPRLLLDAAPANLECHLAALWQQSHSTPVAAAGEAAGAWAGEGLTANLVCFDAEGRVYVDVWTRAPASETAQGLLGLGFDLLGLSAAHHLLEGSLPIESLAQAASFPGVLSITPVYEPIRRAGSVTSEGDAVHNSDDARDPVQFPPDGFDGSGVKVGVLSDSATYLAGSQATGDLPDYIERLAHIPCTDEGRALLEIIHDLSPGADLSFRSVVLGELDFAQGIRDMAAAGAKVIVDDLILPQEPFFQDGIIAQAVDEVVEQYGVFYVAAAGNEGDLGYEHSYEEDGTGWHDFDPTTAADNRQTITVPAATPGYYWPMRLALQWDQPFYTVDGVVSDFDVFVYDATGTVEVASATTDNVATQQPLEVVSWDADGTSPTEYTIGVRHNGGPTSVRLKYVLVGPDGLTIDEYATHSPTVVGHPAAAKAVAVGAVPWDSPDQIEPFSSIGPATIYFDPEGNPLGSAEIRHKPDLVATDGVSTTLPAYSPFLGTSAAAPHVAAIAAQMWDVNPHLTRDELYQVLTSTAADLGEPGPDYVYGYGRADALPAASAAAAVLDVTSPRILDISPDEVVGWHVNRITLEFTEPLASATATSPANYDLREAGPDGQFDTADDTVFTVAPSYEELGTTSEVVLTMTAPESELSVGEYRLTLEGDSSIADPSGNPLSGGTDEVYYFAVAAEPPEVDWTGSHAFGHSWCLRDDGWSFVATGYNPSIQGYKWPQILVTPRDPNAHLSHPGWSIPTDQLESFRAINPDIALDSQGGAVAWADYMEIIHGSPDTFDINLQLLDAAGHAVGPFVLVDVVWASRFNAPRVAIGQQRVVVVYRHQVAGVDHVFAAVLDRSGATVRDGFVVHEDTQHQFDPRVAMDGAGNFIVAWDSATGDAIRGRRFDADGNPLGDVFIINTSTSGQRSGAGVAAVPDGRFVVVWIEEADTDRPGLHFRLYDAAGSPVSAPRRVLPGSVGGACVGMADDGRFVITWQSPDQDHTGIYARRYSAGGEGEGDYYWLNSSQVGTQSGAGVAVMGDGDFVAHWTDEAADRYLARWCTWDSSLPVAAFGPWVESVYHGAPAEGPLESVSVQFDRPIALGTLQPEDIEIKSPAGHVLPLRGVDPVTPTIDPQTYEIHLAEAAVMRGTYRVRIGPGVEDSSGWQMNQDGDATNGETEDAYQATLSIDPVAFAGFPLNEGFEGGELDGLGGHWSFATRDDGLLKISSEHDPRAGSFHLLMDQDGNTYGGETVVLHLDLAGRSGVTLDFWAKELLDTDGIARIWIRDDEATPWHEMCYLGTVWTTGSHYQTYRHHAIDLDAEVAQAGMSFSADFQIKFTHDYGYYSRLSGFAWDDVRVMTTGEDLFGARIEGMSVPEAPLGPVTHVEVTFSEEIWAASFAPEDVKVWQPCGVAVPLSAGAPIVPTADPRIFQIHFDSPQTMPGVYRVQVGPEVLDASPWHNPMDQNPDGIVGGAHDAYEGTFEVAAVPPGVAPYDEGFECGDIAALGGHWGFETQREGLLQVDANDSPHGGSYHLRMDQPGSPYFSDGGLGGEAAVLHLDLSGQLEGVVVLEFWAKELYDNDGVAAVAIPDAQGEWHEMCSLRASGAGSHYQTWRRHTIGLDFEIVQAGISYSDDFMIKFSHTYGHYSRHSAFVFDDIRVLLALPGDANVNGVVDGADYTAWADHYHQSGDWGSGDWTGDGFVDGSDYTAWADHYGESVARALAGETEQSTVPAHAVSLGNRMDVDALGPAASLRRQRPVSLPRHRTDEAGTAVRPAGEHLGVTVAGMDLLSMPSREPEGLLNARAVRQRPSVPRRISRVDWRLAPDLLDLLASQGLSVLEPVL